jgi:hypothetical protein
MKKVNFPGYYFALIFVCLVSACVGTSPKSQSAPDSTVVIPTTSQAPDWVNKGCEGQMIFCGIGSASTLGDYTIGRKEADSSALVELRASMEVYVAELLESYKKRVVSGDPKAVGIMGQTEIALKRVVGGTLTGARIADHWEHPTKSLIFSVAKVDLNSFKNNVNQMNELSEEFKEHVRKNADRMLQKLDDELEKRK